MRKITNLAFVAGTLALVAQLSGCGVSEPSEGEMIDAMLAFDQGHAFFGSPEKFREQAKKLGCEKLGEKTYKCLVGKRDGKGGSMPFSFMKTDEKWVMTTPGMSP